jgi:uncharacterized protein YndB with AHSA1/START domain
MTNPVTVTTPTDCEIVITRSFDAPKSLVWDAMNKPECLRRWLLGPPGWEMTVCENDVRVGGTFRHVWKSTDGTEMAMSGIYREVARPDRVVRTETFEFGCTPQAGEQIGTMVLTESAGRTTVTITSLFPTREARDGMIASGMERGVTASYARLDDVLASMAR